MVVTSSREFSVVTCSNSATIQSGDGLVEEQPLTLGTRHCVREKVPVGCSRAIRLQIDSMAEFVGHDDMASWHFYMKNKTELLTAECTTLAFSIKAGRTDRHCPTICTCWTS